MRRIIIPVIFPVLSPHPDERVELRTRATVASRPRGRRRKESGDEQGRRRTLSRARVVCLFDLVYIQH